MDDLIFIGNNPNLFEDFQKVMSCEFEMTDIGFISYYLGLEVKQMNNDIFYAKKVLDKFKMFDCNPLNTPMEVCRFMESPTSTHMKVAKRILRYLKGDVDDRKSTTGFVFFMGAEYVVATSYTCQAIWLRILLKEFNMNQEESTKIHIDNKFAQVHAKNPVFHEQNKHIDIRYISLKNALSRKK
ncbi:hypothetical protein CR513_10173, partial [Mucuna pruriens]